MFLDHQKSDRVAVIAHRGGCGLRPENTLDALEHAREIGADFSEIDLHMSRDGVLVAIHDSTVDRTTNGVGLVQDLTLAQLKRLDAGYRWTADQGKTFPFRDRNICIPTLKEILHAFPQQAIILEIKQRQPAILAELCYILRRYSMTQHVLVSGFHHRTLKTFRVLCPEVASSASSHELIYTKWLSRFCLPYALPTDFLTVPRYALTKALIRNIHRRNKIIYVWTINHPQEMQRMIEWKVDGILTDFPDRLIQLQNLS
jgi:glycerophosphoryl diester phosphodiesterase